MLTIDDLTFRRAGRLILERASAAVPKGHKVGLVGRNGSGKTTLLALIAGEIAPDHGLIRRARDARIGTVAQDAPGSEASILATVLEGDRLRSSLIAELDGGPDSLRMAEIHTRLTDIDAHSAPARAATILAGLGFKSQALAMPCSSLSGGWRTRVALAAALFADPDILLLDEPTNYLDFEGTIWLRNFIRRFQGTALVVSHDRDFLNFAVDSILHLDRGKLQLYVGNFDSFDRQRREKQSLVRKLRKKQDTQRRHMQSFVDRFRYKESKARQAQSRLKAIARLEPISEMIEDRVVPFIFPNPATLLSPPLIQLEGVAAGYERDRPVLRNMNLRIDPDDRIALLGQNGNGKSTFAKLLCGRLPAMAGLIRHHARLVTGYFAQHQIGELDRNRSPYDYFHELMPVATEAQRRARLGSYGFGANLANACCATLSGGETARLLFALAASSGPNLLVMDEPTNHLDIDSREALVHAINSYSGAVVLISHDQHLIETTADRLWLVEDGTVRPFDGDVREYAEYVLERIRRDQRGDHESPRDSISPTIARNQRRIAAAYRAEATPLRRKIADIDAVINSLGDKIAVLDRALSDGALYRTEPERAQDFARLRARLTKELAESECRWLEAHEELQTLEHGLRRAPEN
jgi:ATP-binding cassette subfamily F protein 3